MSRTAIAAAAAAAIAARASYAMLRARPPGGEKTWTRTNHRGEPVTLLEGPAVAIGAIAGAALAPGMTPEGKAAIMVAGTGAAIFGGYDDLAGDGASKGFRGHLGALRRGELTSGAVKLAGIGATGLAAALILGRRPPAGFAADDGTAPRLRAADAIINAGLVAGGANLLNLFDLRPGRAIKVAIGAGALMAAAQGRPGPGAASLAGGLPATESRQGRSTARASLPRGSRARGSLAAAPLAAAPVWAAAALLPDDLGERAMLGDAGANAVGAMLGVAATALPRPARVTVLAGIAGLTAASEVVSFSRVIERTGPLHWLDMLGRRAPRAERPR